MNRICNKCGKSKPIESFQSKGENGKRRATCRACWRKAWRVRQKINKPISLPIIKDPSLCRCGMKPLEGRTRCQNCINIDNKQRVKDRYRIRRIVIEHYGGRCKFCDISETMFLTIDHVEGGGKVHRKESGEQNICRLLYRQSLKEGAFPTGFQVLCWNCNSAKHIHGAEAVKEVIRLRGLNSRSAVVVGETDVLTDISYRKVGEEEHAGYA